MILRNGLGAHHHHRHHWFGVFRFYGFVVCVIFVIFVCFVGGLRFQKSVCECGILGVVFPFFVGILEFWVWSVGLSCVCTFCTECFSEH